MKVKDLMSTNISCITEESSVFHIAQQMQREDVGSLPVCSQQGQLLGMVTDRDLVLRALARSIDDLSSLTAKDIMSLHPVSITPDMDSHDAALVFSSHRIRRLPVTENAKSWSACFPWVIWPAGRSALMKREMYCPLSVLPLVWTEICQQKIDFAAVCIYIINKNANSITKFKDFAVSPSFQ